MSRSTRVSFFLDPLLSLPSSQLDLRDHDLFNGSLLDPVLGHNLQWVCSQLAA